MQKYFPNEMIGNKYGKLTVISIEKQNEKTLLNCKCDCGNHIIREVYMIGSGVVKSCGCARSEAIKRYNASGQHSRSRFKDGRSLHPLYGTWFQMISRCENPNQKHYDRYGGRGIKVCEEWHDFWKFVEWSDSVGGRPKGFTLDRVNNDGNYEPCNCRWADWHTQTTNKSSNVFLEYNGETKTVTDWSKTFNIHPHTLQERLKNGWSVEKALTDKPSENCHDSRNKILFQRDKNGNIVGKYNSLAEVPKNFNKKSITDSIYRKGTCYGYIWNYEGE